MVTNRIVRFAAAAALAGALPACAAAAPAYTPDDGRDDRPGLQAEIDRLAAAGGGVLQLGRGTYDIAGPLYLRSGVQLRGAGRETILTNRRFNNIAGWYGAVVFAGNLANSSFAWHDGQGFAGRPLTRVAANEIEVRGCTRAELATLNGEVVWLSSVDMDRAPLNEVRSYRWELPVYGEMNLVQSVDGCRIRLADPIQVPASEPLLVYWRDRITFEPVAPRFKEPNAAIKNAGLHDMQIDSARGEAFTVSGCYRCEFTNLHLPTTRRLAGAQAIRHGLFRNISGDYSQIAIEFAKFASQTVVDGLTGRYVGQAQAPRPAIRIAEYPRNNSIRNVDLQLGRAYSRRSDLISFGGSGENLVENVKLRVDGRAALRPRQLFYRPQRRGGQWDGRLPPGTKLSGISVCDDSGGVNCRLVEQ